MKREINLYQLYFVWWSRQMEREPVYSGILADDMDLGKIMSALIMHH